MFEVVIVGGGPAGLSAALVLGRCRRRVILFDTGRPRNVASRELHGYLTRDCTHPLELLRLGRAELQSYSVETRDMEVTGVTSLADGFEVKLANGERLASRAVLMATGVRDDLPEIPGLRECYGISAHHCPYCDGWESRDKSIAVIGAGARVTGLSLSLKTWSERIVACSNGSRVASRYRQQLTQHAIDLRTQRISSVEHENGRVVRMLLADGQSLPCEAIFFSAGQSLQCDVPRQLGCELTRHGVVKTDYLGQTRVPGLYVVGDASRDVQFAIVAAAEGAKAAVAINKALQVRSGLAVQA